MADVAIRYSCPTRDECRLCGTADGHRHELLIRRGEKVPTCPTHKVKLVQVAP